MYGDERKEAILKFLEKKKMARVSSLLDVTECSMVTLRRDIHKLVEERLIEKSHGVVKLKNNYMRNNTMPDDDTEAEEKDRIAKAAADLVNDGDRIFIGAGKTCAFLAKHIQEKNDLVIVTTNLNAVMELSRHKQHSISLLGGDVHVGSNYVETLNEYTVDSLKNLYFNKVFITVNGVELDYGYTINSQLQVSLYQHLLKNAEDFFMLVDRSKFNKRTFILLCEMDKIHNVVTCGDVDPQYFEFYRDNGIKVHIV